MSISTYRTNTGELRYRVRYRKPDGTQTDRRGFKRKKDAQLWEADHVTVAIAKGSYVDPASAKSTIGDLWPAWIAKKKVRRPVARVDREEEGERETQLPRRPGGRVRQVRGHVLGQHPDRQGIARRRAAVGRRHDPRARRRQGEERERRPQGVRHPRRHPRRRRGRQPHPPQSRARRQPAPQTPTHTPHLPHRTAIVRPRGRVRPIPCVRADARADRPAVGRGDRADHPRRGAT